MMSLGWWVLTTLLSAFVGSFLAAYLKKKGENLATQEDLNKLTAQVEATTETAKRIEGKISDELWNRQRQWEMRRDALFSTVRALDHAHFGLIGLWVVYVTAETTLASEVDREQMRREKSAEWLKAISEFDEARAIASFVCNQAISATLFSTGQWMRSSASEIFKGRFKQDDVGSLASVAKQKINEFLDLARREIGITMKSEAPQQTSSS